MHMVQQIRMEVCQGSSGANQVLLPQNIVP